MLGLARRDECFNTAGREKTSFDIGRGSFTSYTKNDAGSDLSAATSRGEAETACKNRRGFLWLVWHFVKSDTITRAGLDTAALWAM